MLRGGDPARNLLRWRIGDGGLATLAELKDPASGAPALRVCLYDGSSATQPRLASTIPAGGTCGTKACWKALGGAGGYRYRNRAATPEGVTALKLKIAGQGELQLLVKGKGADLPMPALGLVTPVTVQLAISEGGQTDCWEATFASALHDDASIFRAKSP